MQHNHDERTYYVIPWYTANLDGQEEKRRRILWNIQGGFAGGLDGRPCAGSRDALLLSSVAAKDIGQLKFQELGVLHTAHGD